METFISTNDGKYACLRHRGTLYYGKAPDELAKELGIADGEWTWDIDQEAAEREAKRLRRRVVRHTDEDHWGY
jgi:hypothetical protein